MHFFTAAGFAAALLVNGINSQACAQGSAQDIKGNWYCSEVKAITYQNFPGNGSYSKVTDMDEKTGECETEKFEYTGSLAPLNEELSVHIRGPIWLTQFAVYKPGSTSQNRPRSKHGSHARRHQAHHYGHGHDHHGHANEINEHEIGKRSVGQLISATIDGQVVSWTNAYAGPGVASSLPSPVGVHMDEANGPAPDSSTQNFETLEATSPSSSVVETSPATTHFPTTTLRFSPKSTSKTSPEPVASGNWIRRAYYDAAGGIAQGVTFLNHFGGTDGIPGTAAGGPAFGASLSYASTDGKSGAKSPQILSDGLIEDDVEVIIMSNRSCDDDGCGYARPGGVNYHGFEGSEKVFLFEFSMPDTGKTGFAADMPAIWVLNAQVPRTSQYGTNTDCSCWTSGCGEFDLFEILDSGNSRCKSTLHMEPAGGSSDWLRRPTGGSITAAMVIGGSSEVAAIRVLDQRQSFGESLSESTVEDWLALKGSVFRMAD